MRPLWKAAVLYGNHATVRVAVIERKMPPLWKTNRYQVSINRSLFWCCNSDYLVKGDSEAFLYWLFIMTMTLISLFDMETMEFSTGLLFFLALVGIMISFTNNASLVSRILGSMTLSLPLLSVNRLREVIGDGDIFIFMITGWAFGCEFLFRSVLITCITGLMFSLVTGKRKMPFCPFLTIGIMASLL